jgi:hypothetical protein
MDLDNARKADDNGKDAELTGLASLPSQIAARAPAANPKFRLSPIITVFAAGLGLVSALLAMFDHDSCLKFYSCRMAYKIIVSTLLAMFDHNSCLKFYSDVRWSCSAH